MHDDGLFNSFPVIHLRGGFVLRQPESSIKEASLYLRNVHNPNIARFIPDECIPRSIEQAMNTLRNFRNLFEFKESVFWVIADSNNDFIGTIGFFEFNKFHRRLEISYEISQDFWNLGITTEALKAIIPFAFEVMKASRIQANTVVYNDTSVHLLKKVGFELEGVLKQYKFYKGEFVDINMLGYSSKQYFADKNQKYINLRTQKVYPESIFLRTMKRVGNGA